jgi:hypothetical protein
MPQQLNLGLKDYNYTKYFPPSPGRTIANSIRPYEAVGDNEKYSILDNLRTFQLNVLLIQ